MKNMKLLIAAMGSCLIYFLTISNVLAQPKIPDITGVNDVTLKLACKLTILQGDKASLSITGDKEALEDVEIKLVGEKLKIYRENRRQEKNDVSVTITLPDLKKLSIAGAVDLRSPNTLSFEELSFDVSGVANFDLKLKSKTVILDASGVISGELSGEASNFKIDVSGVGKLDATEFRTYNCKAEVSGVANISINTQGRLDASVSGMGNIGYLGKPVVNSNSSGVGRIHRL